MGTAFKVTLPYFEGPLDLLLFLVRKNEVNIFDIPISTILDEYVATLSLMSSMNIELASEFMVMAATLAHIKSRLLIRSGSTFDLDDDVSHDLSELTNQLLEYERFKRAALYMEDNIKLNSSIFKRPPMITLPDEVTSASKQIDISMYDLVKAFHSILEHKKDDTPLDIDPERFSVKEGMDHIISLFSRSRRIGFAQIFASVETKQECIVLFLSVLEMVKLGFTKISQVEAMEPIFIEATDNLMLM